MQKETVFGVKTFFWCLKTLVWLLWLLADAIRGLFAGQVYKKVMAGEKPKNLLRVKEPCTSKGWGWAPRAFLSSKRYTSPRDWRLFAHFSFSHLFMSFLGDMEISRVFEAENSLVESLELIFIWWSSEWLHIVCGNFFRDQRLIVWKGKPLASFGLGKVEGFRLKNPSQEAFQEA